MLIWTDSLYESPMCILDWGLWQELVSTSQQQLVGLWSREFSFEGQLLACYWTLIETASMTKSHKIILKPEILMMFCVMFHRGGKCSEEFHNKIKIVYIGSCCLAMQRGDTKETGASFPRADSGTL